MRSPTSEARMRRELTPEVLDELEADPDGAHSTDDVLSLIAAARENAELRRELGEARFRYEELHDAYRHNLAALSDVKRERDEARAEADPARFDRICAAAEPLEVEE